MAELLSTGEPVTIERVGFFRELRHGEADGPSLSAIRDRLDAADVEMVAGYLDSAPTLAATGSLVDDVLDPGKKGVARLEIATDGAWVWPRDLGYYVRTYRVALPPEFVATIRARQGAPPAMSDADLARAEAEYLG